MLHSAIRSITQSRNRRRGGIGRVASLIAQVHTDTSSSDDDDDEMTTTSSDDDDSEGDIWLPRNERKARSSSKKYTVADRYDSVFYKKYILPAQQHNSPFKDQNCFMYKQFRKRFHVPYELFEEIVADVKRINRIPDDKKDATGQESVILPLLVLGSLRVLATGCTFDAIEELTNVHEETHRVFFHKQFCMWGERVAHEHIQMPFDEDTLRHVAGPYNMLGLPGCVGSIDCVHLIWDKCPASIRSLCKGKNDVPTLAFEVVASHTRRILSVSQYFWGTVNDKTISRMDAAFDHFRNEGTFLREYKWNSRDADGNLVDHKGVYMICDGGYNNWPCLTCPYKHQALGSSMEKWSKRVESVRKDVECVFGSLKKRFLLLKHPIRLHCPYSIERAFVTCCLIHNLIHNFDGWDEWEVEYGALEQIGEDVAATSPYAFANAGVRSQNRDEYGVLDDDEPGGDQHDGPNDDGAQFYYRRSCLIDHLTYYLMDGLMARRR